MSVLNQYNCLTSEGNTEAGQCPIDIDAIVGFILLPRSKFFTATDMATVDSFVTALQDATLAPKGERIYPVHDIEQQNDQSEENTYETRALGSMAKVRDGRMDITYRLNVGGLCLYQQLSKFEKRTDMAALFIDESGLVFGQQRDGNMYGVPLEMIDSPRLVYNSGSATTIYGIRLRYKQNFLKSGFGSVKLDPSDWDSIRGLQTLVIESGGARAAAVSQIKLRIGCGLTSDDFYDTYGALIASNDALVLAKNSVTGNQLTVTAVAANTNTKGFSVTVDTADPDYNAAQPVVIYFDTPAAIAAAIPALHVESNVFTTPN